MRNQKPKTLQERFEEFDAKHPEIYATFKQYALRIRVRRTNYSARLILSGISFNTMLDGRDIDEYKINNDFSSRYARKLIKEDPLNFGQFFATRKLKAA